MASLFQAERDSIAFLGLLSIAYKKFDFQIQHPDKEITHAYGLNIFAAIIDNTDGELLGQQKNLIHTYNNPMMHAEQLTLKEAIERVNAKRPRNASTTSAENYYRNFLFYDNDPGDYLNAGATLYTTLEPCPFCASASLVTRMKRVVYIIPDKRFGGAYGKLKTDHYPAYDTSYEQLNIPVFTESDLTRFANAQYSRLLSKVEELKKANPKLYDTLLTDYMNDLLKDCYTYFSSLTEQAIVTIGNERERNTKTLTAFQVR